MTKIENIAFGLVGASGVGKGYVRDAFFKAYRGRFSESVVVTTRSRRPSDGPDRWCVKPPKFDEMVRSGDVIFEHKPFRNDDMYGYLLSSLKSSISHVLVEPHVTKIPDFRKLYGENLVLLGLISDEDYLRRNLKGRGEGEIKTRLAAASEVERTLKEYRVSNTIDEMFYITHDTRRVIADFVIMFAGTWLGLESNKPMGKSLSKFTFDENSWTM